MALGDRLRGNQPTETPAPAKPATPAPTSAPTAAPEKPEAKEVTTTTPADMLFKFTDTDVPGRVTASDVTADPEYTALRDKLLAHWELVKSGKVGPRHGIEFPSHNVSRHEAFLRKAANEYNENLADGETQLGVAIRKTDVDKVANTGKISFRAKVRKNYDK